MKVSSFSLNCVIIRMIVSIEHTTQINSMVIVSLSAHTQFKEGRKEEGLGARTGVYCPKRSQKYTLPVRGLYRSVMRPTTSSQEPAYCKSPEPGYHMLLLSD